MRASEVKEGTCKHLEHQIDELGRMVVLENDVYKVVLGKKSAIPDIRAEPSRLISWSCGPAPLT